MVEISSPLSRENRIQISRSSTISGLLDDRASILAQNPLNTQRTTGPDPETLKFLESNQSSLNAISSGLSTLRQRIDILSNSLSSLSTNIVNDSFLENYREQQKLQQDRSLEQQALRDESEALIERKISSAVTAPVQNVAEKTTSSLSSLMGTLTKFFVGWLAYKGIFQIRDLIDKSFGSLKQIQTSTENTFKFVYDIFDVVKKGVDNIISTVFDFTNSITKFVGDNPLVKFVKGLLPGDDSSNKDSPTPTSSPSPSNILNSITSSVSNAVSGLTSNMSPESTGKALSETSAEGLAKMASRFIPGANIPIASSLAYKDMQQGDIPGAVLDMGTILPGAFGLASMAGSALYESVTGGGIKSKTQPTQNRPQTNPQIQPKESKVNTPAPPESKDNVKTPEKSPELQTPFVIQPPSSVQNGEQINADAATSSVNFGDQLTNINSKIFPTFSESKNYAVDLSSVLDIKNPLRTEDDSLMPYASEVAAERAITSPIPSPIIEGIQKPSSDVKPVEKPRPNITVAPMPQQASSPPPSSPQMSSSSNEVPAIPSSNPDNFYALYSQIHYNVVI